MYRRHRTNVTSILCPFNSNSPVCALRNDTRWSPVESRKKARDHTGLHRLWLPLMVWVGKLKCVKSDSCEFKAWQADFFEHDFNFLANYCNNSRSRTVWQGLAPTVEPEQQFSFSIHYFLRFQSKVNLPHRVFQLAVCLAHQQVYNSVSFEEVACDRFSPSKHFQVVLLLARLWWGQMDHFCFPSG